MGSKSFFSNSLSKSCCMRSTKSDEIFMWYFKYLIELPLYKKWSFPLKISPVNVTKSASKWKTSFFLWSVLIPKEKHITFGDIIFWKVVLLLEKKIFLIKNTKKKNIILKPSLNADQPTWQITTKYFSCNYFENYVYAVILFVYGDNDLSAFRFRRNNLHHLHYFTAFHEFLKIFQEFSNLKKTFTL